MKEDFEKNIYENYKNLESLNKIWQKR